MPHQGTSPRTSPSSDSISLAPQIAPLAPATAESNRSKKNETTANSTPVPQRDDASCSQEHREEQDKKEKDDHEDEASVKESLDCENGKQPIHPPAAEDRQAPSPSTTTGSQNQHPPPVTPSPQAHSRKSETSDNNHQSDAKRNKENMQMSVHGHGGLAPSPIKVLQRDPKEEERTKNTAKRKSPVVAGKDKVVPNKKARPDNTTSSGRKLSPSIIAAEDSPRQGDSPVQAEQESCSDQDEKQTIISPASSANEDSHKPTSPSRKPTNERQQEGKQHPPYSPASHQQHTPQHTPQHSVPTPKSYPPTHPAAAAMVPSLYHPHAAALGLHYVPQHLHPHHPHHHSPGMTPHFVTSAAHSPWMHHPGTPVGVPAAYYSLAGYAPQYYAVAVHPTPPPPQFGMGSPSSPYNAAALAASLVPPQPHLVVSSSSSSANRPHHSSPPAPPPRCAPPSPPSPPKPPSPPPPPQPRKKNRETNKTEEVKKSIEEWQKTRATIGNKARCVPVEHPTKAQPNVSNPEEIEIKLPDFPLLVNFPEHLTRGQTRGTGDNKGLAPEGKRHCVMCGQLRICSSSANRLNRSTAPSAAETSSCKDQAPAPSSSTVHIIPRQNKGVCTACDVTVWTVVQHDGGNGTTLEIKWCKGCKNFRPWPAFGEKGLATKCARCRHRQREKYALQKKQGSGGTSQYDDHHHYTTTSARHPQRDDDLLAAQGLSNLMRAQNA
ncbi:hypothetical protein ACA910_011971 [Epithemia clementina (nom. ined.)]